MAQQLVQYPCEYYRKVTVKRGLLLQSKTVPSVPDYYKTLLATAFTVRGAFDSISTNTPIIKYRSFCNTRRSKEQEEATQHGTNKRYNQLTGKNFVGNIIRRSDPNKNPKVLNTLPSKSLS